MKKFLLFFYFGIIVNLCLAQSPLESRLDFLVNQQTIPEAIKNLTATTGVPISFSDNFFDPNTRITLRFKQKKIEEILQKILANTPVDYQLIGQQIILRKKPKRRRKYTLSGYIQEADDGEKLIAATVYSPDHQQGTISNEYGFFSLTLPEGSTNLICSYLGSAEKELEILLDKNQLVEIELERSFTLAEVEVRPEEEIGQQIFSTSPSANEVAISQLERIPDLGGESDLLRAAQLLPGVQSGADGLGGLHVRGGNSDQNLMLLDGVPIYNPNHLLGIFSVFNTTAIRDAKLIKGTFPARYGGRISSVFDVRTREGNEKNWGGELSTGLVSSKLTLEGPIAKKKGALLFTGRRTHSSFLLDSIVRAVFYPNNDGTIRYTFYDFNAKANYSFSEKDRVFFSFYKGGDKFSTQEEEEEVTEDIYTATNVETNLAWGNLISSFRWNHLFGNKLFANTTLTYSNYFYENAILEDLFINDENEPEEVEEFFFQESNSNIRDIAAKIDFDYVPSPLHYIRFGAGYTHHRFLPDINIFEGDIEDLPTTNDSLSIEDFSVLFGGQVFLAQEFHAYLEDELQINQRWHANLGLRFSGFRPEGASYFNAEPRIGIRYTVSPAWSIHAGWSRMVQYLHRVTAIGLSKPDDVWIPSTANIKPQSSWQGGLSLQYSSPEKLDISIETYWKKMQNIVSFNDTTFTLQSGENFDQGLITGQGLAYGLEFLIKKDFGKTGGHFAYSLAHAKRQYDDLNLGKAYSFIYDRRHQASFFLFHKFNEQIELSATWLFGSANPVLAVEENLAFGFKRVIINSAGEKNEYREVQYHRLDLSLLFKWHKPRFQHTFKLGAYNVYNNQNQAFLRLVYDEPSATSEFVPVSFLPFLPSFSYSLRF